MNRKTIFLFLSAAALSSCTMAPVYEPPAFPAAESWGETRECREDGCGIKAQQTGWQDFFAAPEIVQVVDTALQNNRDLRIAALNVEEARALYRIERADLVPGLDANGAGTVTHTSDESSTTGRAAKTEIYDANLGIAAYELDLFGKIRSLSEAAVNDYLSTRESHRAVRNVLIAETANAYLQLLADQKLLSLTEKTLEAQKRTYDILSESLDKGVSTEQDVARAATAVESARVNFHQYSRFVAQDKNALFLLMGVPRDDALLPAATLDNIAIRENLDAGMPSGVLLARPDIRQAEYALKARNADIGAARAAFFPSITLTGTYGFASRSLGDLFAGGAAGAWTFLPEVTLPIFQGGRNKANLDLAEIRKEKAVTDYEKAIQAAFREVADELAARETLDEQLAAQNRLVAAAQKVYDISQARYKSGIDSFLSVLDAQRELYTHQQTEIQTQRQRLSNLVNLYKVLGGGTPEEE